jgi:hypothetical protein
LSRRSGVQNAAMTGESLDRAIAVAEPSSSACSACSRNGDQTELNRRELSRPAITAITGMRKAHRTLFSERDYGAVRTLGDDHDAAYPRWVAR